MTIRLSEEGRTPVQMGSRTASPDEVHADGGALIRRRTLIAQTKNLDIGTPCCDDCASFANRRAK